MVIDFVSGSVFWIKCTAGMNVQPTSVKSLKHYITLFVSHAKTSSSHLNLN